MQFADGLEVVGVEGSEVVSMGCVQDIRTAVYFVAQPLPQPQWANGVAGLGHSSRHPNLLDEAATAGEIASSAYVLSLSASGLSYFYFGELPPEIVAGSLKLPNHSPDYFSLEVIGFSVGGWEYETEVADRAVLDSTSAFLLNARLYSAVVARFFQGCLGAAGCLCGQTAEWPTFALMFAGAEAYVRPEDYVQVLENSNCSFSFGAAETDTLVLGSAFFYGYNVTLDKQEHQVGLQGDLTPVQLLDSPAFALSQFVLLPAAALLAAYSAWLLHHLQLTRRPKTASRLSEITLAERFVDSE
jgi:hypothetical protein